MSFADLGLSHNALKAIELLGYTDPTPVQEQAIPKVLRGVDIIAAAKTGTGKTAAFSLPGMDRIGRTSAPRATRMLVVTPTRELAFQIADVCETIAQVSRHRVLSVVGGVAIDPQIQKLKKGVDVLIATPGRLIDLMNQQAVRLDRVEILVLDEADRMLDMGFLPSVRTIVSATPETRQTLLFSATIDESVRKQVDSLLNEPEIVQIAHVGETADTVTQYVAHVPQTMKFDMLKATLAHFGSHRVIVFARTRGRADSTCRRLNRLGYSAEALHSDRSQNQRRKALENFANGKTDILVATDVLARGIDVEGVSYVVNFDLPTMPEDYVHRIGRTGRAGADGFAISYVTPETADALNDVQKFIKREIPAIEVEGFSLEQAAAEAADRANRASARKDPDIAQAAKEMKQKEKRKAKAKERAEAEALAQAEKAAKKLKGSAAAGSSKKAKRIKTARALYVKVDEVPEGQPKETKRSSASTSKTDKGKSAARTASGDSRVKTTKRSTASSNKIATKKAGHNAGKSTGSQAKAAAKRLVSGKSASKPASASKQDFRPGRSHRAAVASQRTSKRKSR